MISALHSSRPDGTKDFLISLGNTDVHFGWEEIVQMKQREDDRARSGLPRFVPKLKQSYVEIVGQGYMWLLQNYAAK
jgi:hypothetical protein